MTVRCASANHIVAVRALLAATLWSTVASACLALDHGESRVPEPDAGTTTDVVDAPEDATDATDATDGPADLPDQSDIDQDVVCTDDQDCAEGERCGPAGCQVGIEGDPCVDETDCAGSPLICRPSEFDPVEGGGEPICAPLSTRGVACDDTSDCVPPLLCSPPPLAGLATCQDGNEGEPCEVAAQCGESAPFCGQGACRDGDLDDPCDVAIPTSCETPLRCQDDGYCHEQGFVRIEAGTFMMGCPPEIGEGFDCTEPEAGATARHQVTLSRSFIIGEREITRERWYSTFDNNPGEGDTEEPNCGLCPVTQVNWYEALAYANARSEIADFEACYALEGCAGSAGDVEDPLVCGGVEFVGLDCGGYRLPTEAEWQWAASSGHDEPFESGDVDGDDGEENTCEDPPNHLLSRAWFCANSAILRDVAQHTPSEWGLYDAAGNAFEMVWDAYAPYGTSAATDPTGAAGDFDGRVYRGGAFHSLPADLQLGSRFTASPELRAADRGFRIVRTMNAPDAD